MNEALIKNIIDDIDCHVFGNLCSWKVQPKGDGFLLQLQVLMRDNFCNSVNWQSGRKYYISSHAIKEEVIGTAWTAVQAFVQHEIRETFSYKGVNVFGPHLNYDKLAEFVKTNEEVKRPLSLEQEDASLIAIHAGYEPPS